MVVAIPVLNLLWRLVLRDSIAVGNADESAIITVVGETLRLVDRWTSCLTEGITVIVVVLTSVTVNTRIGDAVFSCYARPVREVLGVAPAVPSISTIADVEAFTGYSVCEDVLSVLAVSHLDAALINGVSEVFELLNLVALVLEKTGRMVSVDVALVA